MTPEFFNAQWLAEYLNVKPRTVHYLSRTGLFPAYRLGHRTVRYRLSEVMAAMESVEHSA